MKIVITILFLAPFIGFCQFWQVIQPPVPFVPVITKFNLSSASRVCSGCNNLAGAPNTAIRSATDPTTGISCSTFSTANWASGGGAGAADGFGTQAADSMTDCNGTANAIMYNAFFNLQAYDHTKIQFRISGLVPGAKYTIRCGGATVNGSVGTRQSGWAVEGTSLSAQKSYNPGDATNGANKDAIVTFSGNIATSSGTLDLFFFSTSTAQAIGGGIYVQTEPN